MTNDRFGTVHAATAQGKLRRCRTDRLALSVELDDQWPFKPAEDPGWLIGLRWRFSAVIATPSP